MFGFGMSGTASASHSNTEQDLNKVENQNTYGSSNTTGTATNSGATTAFQDPLTTQFRQGLFNQYNTALAQTNTPIYGTGFQAAYAGAQNTAQQAGADKLRQDLAASGQLDSGSLGAGLTSLEANKENNNAQLEANLPSMEAAAQTARQTPLLTGANALAAAGPVSTTTVGNQATSQDSQYQQTLNDVINQILKSSMTSFGGSVEGHAGI